MSEEQIESSNQTRKIAREDSSAEDRFKRWQQRHHPRRLRHRRGDAVGAAVLISLGAAFLLNNFGVIPWRVWGMLWRFWPVLLILAGLQTISGRSWLTSLLVLLVGLFLITLLVVSVFGIAHPQFRMWFR